MPKRFSASLFWVNFFTGITDGLVLPVVACILAFPFFPVRTAAIACVGIVVSILGSVAFGLARYFGELSEILHHHPRLSHDESMKEQALMRHIGIDADLSGTMGSQMDNEKQQWLEEVRENNLGWERLDKARAGYSALQTGIGFLCAGTLSQLPVSMFLKAHVVYTIPGLPELLPYFIFPLVALFMVGGWKAVYTGRKFTAGAIFTLAYGLLVFALAVFIAWLLLRE